MSIRERVLELLDYNPETGEFRWKAGRGSAKAGAVAGCIDKYGYIQIRVDGNLHYAHRLAWLIATGALPKGQIDHINGVQNDNRIDNLRDVSVSVNQQNRKSANANSKTGCPGVDWIERLQKFRAVIYDNGKQIHLGCFDKLEDAIAARKSAELIYHPEKPQ